MSLLTRLRRLLGKPVARATFSAASPLTRPADTDVRGRLRSCGVPADVLDGLVLRQVEGEQLREWNARGNRLCVTADAPLNVELVNTILSDDATDTLVVLASDLRDMAYLFVRGAGATVFVGPGSRLPHGELHCGGGSSVVLVGQATGTWHPTLDARNGGSIIAERDQLWATDVIISTDDMHRIADAVTGDRVNSYGGRILLGSHVWLGREVMVFGGAALGDDVVVGARSLVRAHEFPSRCVIGGTPARVIREGTTWSRDDLP
jgi:acetyltransferase-like isoleucine patch superfamily enzyme